MGTYSVGAEVDGMIRDLRLEMKERGGWEPTVQQVLRYALDHALTDIREKGEAEKEESNSAR